MLCGGILQEPSWPIWLQSLISRVMQPAWDMQMRLNGLPRRIFEVKDSADVEAMKAMEEAHEGPRPGWVLRMRGLPFSASAEDVLQFFEGIEVLRGTRGVVFTCTPDGRPLGEIPEPA